VAFAIWGGGGGEVKLHSRIAERTASALWWWVVLLLSTHMQCDAGEPCHSCQAGRWVLQSKKQVAVDQSLTCLKCNPSVALWSRSWVVYRSVLLLPFIGTAAKTSCRGGDQPTCTLLLCGPPQRLIPTQHCPGGCFALTAANHTAPVLLLVLLM